MASTCNVHIGRLSAIGLGKETTPGTAVEPTTWIPVESAEVAPIIKTVEDNSGYGVIDKIADVQAVENTSETSISGIVRANSIGHLFLGVLGKTAKPTKVEDGVYKHAFTLENSNCPLTYTITEDTPVGAKQAPYSVIDSIDIEAKVGDYVRFTVKYMGGTVVRTTDKTPNYTNELPFMASGFVVKMADNIAGLDAAPIVSAQSFKITINKNLETFMKLGSLNVDSIHNTVFEVKGDMEMVYNSDNYMQMAIDGSKKALRVTCESGAKIGATKKAEFGIELPRVALSEWKKSGDADKIITQTLGFVGTFDTATAKTLSMWLQNAIATQY